MTCCLIAEIFIITILADDSSLFDNLIVLIYNSFMANPEIGISPEFRDLQTVIYRNTNEFGEPLVHREHSHILSDFFPEPLDRATIGARSTQQLAVGQTEFEVTIDAFNEALGAVERGSEFPDGVYLNYTFIDTLWSAGDDELRRGGVFYLAIGQLDEGYVHATGEIMGKSWKAYDHQDRQAADELLSRLGITDEITFGYGKKIPEPDDGYRIIDGYLGNKQIQRVTDFILELSANSE